jgi:hypothetical protein
MQAADRETATIHAVPRPEEKRTAQEQVGRTLAGQYRLNRVLGLGGMGAVYEATQLSTGKRIALKLLASHLSRDLKLVTRFRREAVAASRLVHENCVHVDDFGEDEDGTFYIAMEFIPGRGLADELRATGAMSPARVARIGVQLLSALDAAHAAGVLHRDLKPQNVMLMQKPHRPDIVKVVDFGIAKLGSHEPGDEAALTVPGTVFGTPEYMSPEQARGDVLDARSDIYSAAVVLWHMLLGRSPFRGSSVRETLLKVFSEEAPSPAVTRPELLLPAGFEAVLRRALAKNKDDRWPDAGAFAAALLPFVDDEALGIELGRARPGLPVDGSAPPETLDDLGAAAKGIAGLAQLRSRGPGSAETGPESVPVGAASTHDAAGSREATSVDARPGEASKPTGDATTTKASALLASGGDVPPWAVDQSSVEPSAGGPGRLSPADAAPTLPATAILVGEDLSSGPSPPEAHVASVTDATSQDLKNELVDAAAARATDAAPATEAAPAAEGAPPMSVSAIIVVVCGFLALLCGMFVVVALGQTPSLAEAPRSAAVMPSGR